MNQEIVMTNPKKENISMPNNSTSNLKNIINKFVSISDLSRGKASKVVQNVVKNNDQCIIVKNNKPEAVILSLDEYLKLKDIEEKYSELEENIELLELANKRINSYSSGEHLSQEGVLKKYNINEEEIDELMDYVEIE